MIWFIFVLIVGAYVAASLRFIPAEHLENYARCRKSSAFWLANLSLHSIWITAAIQSWIAPASVPWRVRLAGAALILSGNVLVIWARRVNSLFVPALIYVPPHLRVTEGPYLIKHPGYVGFMTTAIGTVFLLGQPWAIWPMLAYESVILYRLIVEEFTLSK